MAAQRKKRGRLSLRHFSSQNSPKTILTRGSQARPIDQRLCSSVGGRKSVLFMQWRLKRKRRNGWSRRAAGSGCITNRLAFQALARGQHDSPYLEPVEGSWEGARSQKTLVGEVNLTIRPGNSSKRDGRQRPEPSIMRSRAGSLKTPVTASFLIASDSSSHRLAIVSFESTVCRTLKSSSRAK